MTRLRLFLIICSLFALLAGCERAADLAKPKHFRRGGVSFDYPGNWKITKDEAIPPGRLIFIEAPGSALVILTVCDPGFDIQLEEYAEEFRKELSTAVPFKLLKNNNLSTSLAGIDCKFSIQLAGINVPHTANITRHVFGESKAICLTQVSDQDRSMVDSGFGLVRRTLNSVASEKSLEAPRPTR